MKTTFGVIVGNRDAFPDHLTKEGRLEIISINYMATIGF